MTRVRAAVLAGLVLAMALPLALAQAQISACARTGKVVPIGGTWELIKAPQFPSGPGQITAFAVKAFDPSIVYATNGKALLRWSDTACTWDTVLELQPAASGDVPLSAVTTTITGVTASQANSASGRVLLTAVEVSDGVGRPHVIVSDSGRTGTFDLADEGLPAVGRPTHLRTAESDPTAAYLAVRAVPGLPGTPVALVPLPGQPGGSGARGALYRSANGGRSWVLASDAGDFAGEVALDDVAVDSINAREVWVVAGGVMRRSTDGGRTYTDAGLPVATQQSRGYDVTAVDSRGARVVAFSRTSSAGRPVALVSFDNGASFGQKPAPAGTVDSVAHYRDASSLWASTTGAGGANLYRYNAQTGRVGSSQRPTAFDGAFQVQVDRKDQRLFVRTTSGIFRTVLTTGAGGKTPPVDVPTDLGGVRTAKPAQLVPRNVELRLEVGKTRTVDYALDLPKRPTPLDVFFVIDNSKSMLTLITKLKQNLSRAITSLQREGVDVWAGASIYRTTEDPPLYARLVDLEKPSPAFFRALAAMDADTAGQHEPVLIALYQAATGEGMEDIAIANLATTCDISPSLPGCRIPPGQNANFRPESLRVFVHATNEAWELEQEGAPSFDRVAAALRDKGIKHVGIAVDDVARPHMERMSRLTGAIAPAGGVDCNGDGSRDIGGGRPLVCDDKGDFSKTLTGILNGVRDLQPIRLTAQRSPVLQTIAPASFSGVNVKQDNRLRFRVTYSCVNLNPGTYEAKISAGLRGAVVAEGLATIICGAPVVPPIPPEPNPPAQPQPQPPGVNPPVQVPVVQMQPVPQVQVNPQLNPNAGSAFEEEEEVQLATAANEVRDREQLAMTGLFGGAVVLSTICAGYAMHQRRTRQDHVFPS